MEKAKLGLLRMLAEEYFLDHVERGNTEKEYYVQWFIEEVQETFEQKHGSYEAWYAEQE